MAKDFLGNTVRRYCIGWDEDLPDGTWGSCHVAYYADREAAERRFQALAADPLMYSAELIDGKTDKYLCKYVRKRAAA